MKEIGIPEVRQILAEVIYEYDGLYEMAMRTPDEKLLKTNLRNDFGLDSLDFEDMFVALYHLYDIDIDARYNISQYKFSNEPTVENFIEMINDCIKVYGL